MTDAQPLLPSSLPALSPEIREKLDAYRDAVVRLADARATCNAAHVAPAHHAKNEARSALEALLGEYVAEIERLRTENYWMQRNHHWTGP